MVKGAENDLYRKLKGRFDALMNTDTQVKLVANRRNDLNEILNSLLKEGLETAMAKYQKE